MGWGLLGRDGHLGLLPDSVQQCMCATSASVLENPKLGASGRCAVVQTAPEDAATLYDHSGNLGAQSSCLQEIWRGCFAVCALGPQRFEDPSTLVKFFGMANKLRFASSWRRERKAGLEAFVQLRRNGNPW